MHIFKNTSKICQSVYIVTHICFTYLYIIGGGDGGLITWPETSNSFGEGVQVTKWCSLMLVSGYFFHKQPGMMLLK